MRTFGVLAAAILVFTAVGRGQFKAQVEQSNQVSSGLMSPSAGSLFLGWFDPEKFHMSHSFDLSYQTGGGEGLSLGTYTNRMRYDFAENLAAGADLSLSYSPYNTLPTISGRKNDLSSIYLSRAHLSYRPWENVLVQVQYRNIPYGSFYYSPYYYPWYRENGF